MGKARTQLHSGFPSVFEMEILEPSRPAYSGGALMRGYACNVLSQLRPRAFYAYLFHVFQVWDSSETHFTTSFFVFCRSGTECHSTQYFYCVLLARDRVCFETAFMSCCVGQEQVVFSYAIRASLIVTYKGCSGTSIYIKFCPSLLSERCGDFRLAEKGGWRLANSFENSWPGVSSACLLSHGPFTSLTL